MLYASVRWPWCADSADCESERSYEKAGGGEHQPHPSLHDREVYPDSELKLNA
ncbi:MAG: hypothetical protein AVDCRST_MAG42-1023 [uncultured Chthoniobacterales bacterium]|uniref:Uncharacterized protein n=1 Tax=uncultured Chthoniobacterales bacterium TaxID=1836801 RepID=A0A6J4HP99_9BACT|nr:MAG: hypothetical protein AVDCRST_MAG42-1023 [uncultured Chthoniobacterales bacterium]